MSNINSVGDNLSNYLYSSLSSGSRIQNAANGASEMAILQKQERQVGGINAGTQNMQMGKDAINIADGAMSGVADSLQRIRELAVQASNGTLSSEDKSYIQMEVDELKKGIAETAGTTNYNGVKLLDNEDGAVISMAINSDGGSKEFSTVNSTLEALGIADFDVTGDFDLSTIDKALEKIGAGRATLGAQSNSFDVAINYNNGISYNTVDSQSRMGDTDYGDYIQKLKQQQLLNQVQVQMQKRRQEDEARKTNGLFQ
ncbi:MAG: flagellin FliC5 [Lachnospiraceae bacterium]|nr:flagellin FliC5 [Lachnospiraceae bacterium]